MGYSSHTGREHHPSPDTSGSDTVAALASQLVGAGIEDIVVLNVTRAVQAAADLAAHVVAAEGYGLPDSLAAAFTLLEGQGVIGSRGGTVRAVSAQEAE
jgi:hypothetical protein